MLVQVIKFKFVCVIKTRQFSNSHAKCTVQVSFVNLNVFLSLLWGTVIKGCTINLYYCQDQICVGWRFRLRYTLYYNKELFNIQLFVNFKVLARRPNGIWAARFAIEFKVCS